MLFESARDFARAAEYFLMAAQQAAHISANKEAVVLARRGLDAIKLRPESPERAEQELRLQTILGPAVMSTEGYGTPEVEAIYVRARELCQHVGETPQLCPVIWGLYQYSLARADYQASRKLGEQLLAVAQKLQDSALLLTAHSSLGNTLSFAGNLEGARTHGEEVLAIYVRQHHHSLAALYGGFDIGAAARGGLGANLWLLGYPDQALQSARDGIALARELAHASTMVLCLLWEAMVHHHRRDAQRTRQQAEAAIALAEEELAPWLAWATMLRGWALAEQGECEKGIAQLRQGITAWKAMGVRALQPLFLALLAQEYATNGETEQALTTLGEALAINEQTHEGYAEAELHRLRGQFVLDSVVAEGCFHHAIEIARRQHAKSFELRATMSLTRLYDKQGRRTEARQMLAEIYGWFTEGFETADLKDAAAMLERLGSEHRT